MKRTFTFLLTALFLCVGMVKAAVTDVPEMSTEGNTVWYTISNTRSVSGKYLYWTEAGLKDANTLSKASLFYFTAGGADTCYIHNAATDSLFSGAGAWTTAGVGCVISETPHASKAGVAIEFNGTALNEQNHADGFTTWSANDAGSIFVISPVVATIKEAVAKIEENKVAGNTIFGQYKYEEESYNALVAALAVLESAEGEEFFAAFESSAAVMASLVLAMPEEGKFYVIECPLFKQVQGVSKALNSTPGWNTLDLTDKNYYWTVEVNDGSYALKNVATGKYLNGTSMSDAPAYAKLNSLGQQQFNIVVNGTTVHANNHASGKGGSGNIVSWGGEANSASAWQFIERVDPATLVEATVTYSFTYEGEEKYTQTTTTFLGEEWPAITVALPFGVSASKPEGVVEPAPTTFYIKNAASGKYLDYDPESNLTTGDAEAVATIVPSSVIDGTFAISYPNPKAAAGVSYVQSGSSGRFSGNTQLTKNSSVYLYKVTSESTATRVETIEDGASYLFVAESSKGGYWMLTNEPYKSGVDLRMIGVKVSDELPGDEITYEQGAEFSPVWSVEAVEVEEEKVESATFNVKNAVSGKYLDFDPATNLTTGDAEAVATIVPSSVIAGTFAISYPDPAGQTGVRYVQSGSSGRFSGNAALTKNSSIYVYKVASESTATRVEAIEDGASYIFVSESTKGGYWMLTNEPYDSGENLRMVGVKVSDELPGDEITYEQGAEFSPVWIVEAVEEEEEVAAVEITKVIELEENLFFEAAENVESISKWYYAKMHSNYPRYIEENAQGGINWVKETVGEHESDSLLWGFVGNAFDGIKLINKATGHAVVSTGGDAQMGDAANATAFVYSATKTNALNGFCLKYPDSSNFLNAHDGKVAEWSDADAGSTFLLEEYVEVTNLAVLGAMAGDVAIVDGAATVESISSFDITFDRPVALAEDAEWAILTDQWGDNPLKAEVLADNNCVVRFSLQWGQVFTESGDFYLYIPEGVVVGAEDANLSNAAFEAVITIEAAPATPLAVVNVTVGEDVMADLSAIVATPEDMIRVNFDGEFYFQGSPVIVDAEGNDASMSFDYMSGLDVDGSNSYILVGKTEGVYTITLPKASFLEMMSFKAPAEDIVLTVQIVKKQTPDGIENINVNVEAVIYDIHGRRVSTMEKGIYIVNGRKVIVK